MNSNDMMTCLRYSLFFFLSGFLICPAFSQENPKKQRFEVTAGPDMLIYQSAYNFQDTYGIEASISGRIYGPLGWQAGFRLGLDPVLPEGFARILTKQEYGVWQPGIGLELGVTGRVYFEEGQALLRETREAMQTDINSVYLAGHVAPAKFCFNKGWTVSALELDLGTHLSHFGRTMRARLGLITIGKRF